MTHFPSITLQLSWGLSFVWLKNIYIGHWISWFEKAAANRLAKYIIFIPSICKISQVKEKPGDWKEQFKHIWETQVISLLLTVSARLRQIARKEYSHIGTVWKLMESI